MSRESISVSLAARGHHENWANDDEAAALSGMTNDQFRKLLPELESAGFPKCHPWNRKRFIKSINAFWEHDIAERWPATVEDESLVENWGPKRHPR